MEEAIEPTNEPSSEAKEVVKLKKELSGLKAKLAITTIAGLLFGGGGAFGVFTYFVERPLKEENESLKAKMSHAELDKRDLGQTIETYEKQLEVLNRQKEMAEKRNTSNAKEWQAQLERKNAQYLRTLEELERERQIKRQSGIGWFGR